MIRFHSLVSFDRSAKSRWLATEMGLAFEDRWLDRDSKENESPAFLRLNPMGRVPVAEFGDLSIFESGAIVTYLADLHPEKNMAPALSSPDRAKYLQWMFFAGCTLDAIQAKIMIIEDIPAGEYKTEKEAAVVSEYADAMEAIDYALAHGDYLVGNRFSAADISVGYHVYFCNMWPELKVCADKFPRIGAHMERLQKMPSAVKAKVFSFEG